MLDIYNETFRTYGTKKIDVHKRYNDFNSAIWLNKPKNGLWASPLEGRGYYTWRNFCKDEDFRLNSLSKHADFKLKKGSKILMLEDTASILRAFKKYKINDGYLISDSYLNWNKISAEYDAVWFNNSKMDFDILYDLRMTSWDCDSICVFNLNAVEVIKK